MLFPKRKKKENRDCLWDSRLHDPADREGDSVSSVGLDRWLYMILCLGNTELTRM